MTPRRSRIVARLAVCALLAIALAAAGCGGGGASGGGNRPDLIVFAATSLKKPLTAYGQAFSAARVKASFAGSDQLAAQIEQGAQPDVFAAANTKLPDALFAKGLVEKPTIFAANRLVIAVPASGWGKVASLADLEKPGVTIAIGSPAVPVGAYTRKVLAALGPGPSRRILANVRSEEPDVGGVIAKVTLGAADAGIVYVTDVRGAEDRARAIDLPARLQPRVAYAAAVVRGTTHAREAQAFVADLRDGAGQAALRRAGFEPPPAPGR